MTTQKFKSLEVGADYVYADGILSTYDSHKKVGDYDIYKGPFYTVAIKGELAAHGKTVKEAIEDLEFKVYSADKDVTDIVQDIKKSGVINKNQYRMITGACKAGVESFLKEKDLKETTVTIEKALELTEGRYGYETFKKLMEQ